MGDTPYTVIVYKWDSNINMDVSFVSGQDNYPLMNPVETEVMPQFPSWIIVPLFLTATLFIVFFRKRLKKGVKSG